MQILKPTPELLNQKLGRGAQQSVSLLVCQVILTCVKVWGLTCAMIAAHHILFLKLSHEMFVPADEPLLPYREEREREAGPDIWSCSGTHNLGAGVQHKEVHRASSDQATLQSGQKQTHSTVTSERRQKQERVQTTKITKIFSILAKISSPCLFAN